MTDRKQLHELIADELYATAHRVLAAHPERRDELADWLEHAHQHLIVRANMDKRSDGRTDTRSLRYDVYLATTAGLAPLLSARRRDLAMPPDIEVEGTQAEARTLLLQQGHGVPDHPGELTDSQ